MYELIAASIAMSIAVEHCLEPLDGWEPSCSLLVDARDYVWQILDVLSELWTLTPPDNWNGIVAMMGAPTVMPSQLTPGRLGRSLKLQRDFAV
jgi:hypothetical protein